MHYIKTQSMATLKQTLTYSKYKIEKSKSKDNYEEIRIKFTKIIKDIKKDYPELHKDYAEWHTNIKTGLPPKYLSFYNELVDGYNKSNSKNLILTTKIGFNISISGNLIVFYLGELHSVKIPSFINKKQIQELKEWFKSNWEQYCNGKHIALQIILKIIEITTPTTKL